MVTSVSIEWHRGDAHVFMGEEHIGIVRYVDVGTDNPEDDWYEAKTPYHPLPIPGRFVYRGDAIAALIKDMPSACLAAQCYVEV